MHESGPTRRRGKRPAAARVSVVVPVYNEASSLAALYDRCHAALASTEGVSLELVYVNDGSTDASILELERLADEKPDVRVVDLARNFGKELALSAGLDHARGDAVVFMDSDLQHPPEILPRFVEKWRQGVDVVIGVREATEKKSIVRRFTSFLYHRIMRAVGDYTAIPGETDYRLIDRAVADAVRRVRERQRLFRGLINWVGFRRDVVTFKAGAREAGAPRYTISKLWELAIHSFVSHSQAPLRWVLYVGIFAVLASALGLVWMTFAEFLVSPIWHYTPLAKVAVGTIGLVGLLQVSVGIVGLYVAKIHHEVVTRPLYVVASVFGAGVDDAASSIAAASTSTPSLTSSSSSSVS